MGDTNLEPPCLYVSVAFTSSYFTWYFQDGFVTNSLAWHSRYNKYSLIKYKGTIFIYMAHYNYNQLTTLTHMPSKTHKLSLCITEIRYQYWGKMRGAKVPLDLPKFDPIVQTITNDGCLAFTAAWIINILAFKGDNIWIGICFLGYLKYHSTKTIANGFQYFCNTLCWIIFLLNDYPYMT